MCKRLYIDTETTGTDCKIHGIHQISGFIEIDGKIVEEFDYKLRPFPGAIIEEEALKVGHVTIEQLSEYPNEERQFLLFKNLLTKYVSEFDKTDKFMVVGYNVRFDIDFVNALCLRNNYKYLFSLIWGNHIDVMSIASEKLETIRKSMENFKLITVAKQLNIPIDESKLHNSMYDIIITKQILEKLNEGKYTLKQDTNVDAFLKSNTSQQPIAQSNHVGGTPFKKTEFRPLEENDIWTIGKKYKGLSIETILLKDPEYIIWAFENLDRIKISDTVINEARYLIRGKS